MRTCYAFITLLLFSPFFWGCNGGANQPSTRDPKASQAAVEKARSALLSSRTSESLEESYFELKAARDPDRRDFETEIAYAQVCFYYGGLLENGDDREKMWESGLEAGRIATRLKEEKVDGYYWAAANLNALAKKNPLTVGIRSTEELRDFATRAADIDPSYEAGGALNILAQLELFTGLVGGTPKKAVEYLERGAHFDTRDGSVRLTLAEAYLLSRRIEDAKRVLREIIEMKPDPNFKREHDIIVAKAKRMLDKRL